MKIRIRKKLIKENFDSDWVRDIRNTISQDFWEGDCTKEDLEELSRKHIDLKNPKKTFSILNYLESHSQKNDVAKMLHSIFFEFIWKQILKDPNSAHKETVQYFFNKVGELTMPFEEWLKLLPISKSLESDQRGSFLMIFLRTFYGPIVEINYRNIGEEVLFEAIKKLISEDSHLTKVAQRIVERIMSLRSKARLPRISQQELSKALGL